MPKPKRDPYQDLGVPRDADAATIKKAFRKKAKQHHPDMQGGGKEKFMAVQRAYDILSDEERRKRFDESGDDDEVNIEKEAAKCLVQIIKEAVAASDIRITDIVSVTRKFIAKQQITGIEEIIKLKKKIAHWQEAGRRIKSKRENFVLASFAVEIEAIAIAIKAIEWDLELSKVMLELLDNYEYRVDKVEEPCFKNNYGMKLPAAFADFLDR